MNIRNPVHCLLILASFTTNVMTAQSHKDPFASARDTAAQWHRMPHVHLSLLGGGFGRFKEDYAGDALTEVSGERRSGGLLEACWRYHDGLCIGIEYGHAYQRVADFTVDNSTYVEYQTIEQGDFIGIDQRMNTFGAFAAVYVAAFPRRHAVGYSLRFSGGLRYTRITEGYRFLLDLERHITPSGWLDGLFNFDAFGFSAGDHGDYNDLKAKWGSMHTVDTASRGALSAMIGLRAELFFSKHLSLILPDVSLNMTFVKAELPDVVHDGDDSDGVESIGAHTVDLTGASISAGIAIHF